MAPSNLAVLTNSHRIIASKKRAKKEQLKEIVFDDTARRDFLTGFHKRKVQKKEAAKQKALDREKQEKLDARREKRQMLAQKAAQNAAEVEKAYGGQVEGEDGSQDEWDGFGEGSSTQGNGNAEEHEEEYENEEQLATVTVVEDFDPEELLHGPSAVPHEDEDYDMEAEPALKPASKADRKKPDAAKTRAKVSKKPKDIKYQTNAVRRVERAKQQKRKKEKAERAGGRGSRKKSSTRGRR